MIAAVADTHAALWYLYGDARLADTAKNVIENALNGDQAIVISAISLIEIIYLIEKGRIPSQAFMRLTSILNDSKTSFKQYPVNLSIAQALSEIDRNQIPDMPDRIIAATALHLGVPIITRDRRIVGSGLTTIW